MGSSLKTPFSLPSSPPDETATDDAAAVPPPPLPLAPPAPAVVGAAVAVEAAAAAEAALSLLPSALALNIDSRSQTRIQPSEPIVINSLMKNEDFYITSYIFYFIQEFH